MSTDKIPHWVDSIGPGWRDILDRLHVDLMEIEPRYMIMQIKEKFGGLRVYFTAPRETFALVQARVDEAISEASKLCERCGAPGELRSLSGWWQTVCPEHGSTREHL